MNPLQEVEKIVLLHPWNISLWPFVPELTYLWPGWLKKYALNTKI